MLESDILIDRARAEVESRNAETFRFMEEQKIRRALAPAQWEAFKESLRVECDRMIRIGVNIVPEFKDSVIHLLNVPKGAVVALAFDDAVPCVHCEIRGRKSHFAFQVVNGTSVMFVDSSNIPKTVAQVVLIVTEALLR